MSGVGVEKVRISRVGVEKMGISGVRVEKMRMKAELGLRKQYESGVRLRR